MTDTDIVIALLVLVMFAALSVVGFMCAQLGERAGFEHGEQAGYRRGVAFERDAWENGRRSPHPALPLDDLPDDLRVRLRSVPHSVTPDDADLDDWARTFDLDVERRMRRARHHRSAR